MPRSRRMPLRRRRHIFHAVVDNFHGPAGFDREQRRMARDHGRVLFFSAECAARLHLHDANLVLGKAAQRHQRLVNVVRALQRTPDGDSIFRIERGDDAVVFDVQLLLRAGEVLALDDVRRFFPDGVYVPLLNQIALEGVVGAPDDCGSLLAFFDRMNRVERLIFDRNGIDSLSKLVTVCMGQKKNRLFGVIDFLSGEARLIVQNQRDAVLPWNVFAKEIFLIIPRATLLRTVAP